MSFKYDIKINIKNEKEVFRLIWLLLFNFLFSMVLLGIPDYIWNVTLWRISIVFVPWLVAIPAMINLKQRKVAFRDIIGEHVLWQLAVGFAIGLGMALLCLFFYCVVWKKEPSVVYIKDYKHLLFFVMKSLLVVGASEELVYRFAIMGQLEQLCIKHRWIAPLAANILYACVHFFQTNFTNVLFAFVQGIVYTLLVFCVKRCRLPMVAMTHGVYDMMVELLPFLYFCFVG